MRSENAQCPTSQRCTSMDYGNTTTGFRTIMEDQLLGLSQYKTSNHTPGDSSVFETRDTTSSSSGAESYDAGSVLLTSDPKPAPTWDTRQEIKLEYMDLDFLCSEQNRCNTNKTPQIHSTYRSAEELYNPNRVLQRSRSEQDLPPYSSRPLEASESEAEIGSSGSVRLLAEQFAKELQPPSESCSSLVNIDCSFNKNEIALATLTGHEKFDPMTHSFSEDELKPQPIIKKSRKQFVPVELKDDKYWARRQKNNMAAKRSREVRRVKENQIVLRASFLEKENLALREEVRKLLQENDRLLRRINEMESVNSHS